MSASEALYSSQSLYYQSRSKPSYYHAASFTPLLHKTIGEVLNETTEKNYEKEFVIFSKDNVRRTFGDFKDEVDRLALGLVHLGVGRGDRVGIWGPNTLEWLHTQYAVASLGAILVNFNPACRTAELQHGLVTAGVKVLVSASTFKTQDYYDMVATICPHITSVSPGKLKSQRLPHLESVILYGGKARPGTSSLDDVMSMGGDDDMKTMDSCRDRVQFDDPSNIIFTSGTTGLPKGATLTHHNSVNHCYLLGKRLGFDTKAHIACAPPPFTHVFGTNITCLTCMTYGITMVIPAPSFEPGATIKAIHDEKCTFLYGAPTMFTSILHHESLKDYDITSVQTVFCGSSSIPPETMKLAQSIMGLDEVLSAYGLTEVGGAVCVSCKDDTMDQRLNTAGKVVDHLEASYGLTEVAGASHISCKQYSMDQRLNSAGKVLEHLETKVIDPESKEVVPIGIAGELCMRGWAVMKGYWGQEDKTREDIDENGWLHTGDIVTQNEEGYCTIESRLKDLIIRGGANIYPAEVENLLHTHPHVQEVQVIGIHDELMGEEVCAVIMMKPGKETSEQDIKEFCKGQISHYKIPRYVRFVDEFPMTVSGKIQKFKLREYIQDSLNGTRD